MKTGSFHAPGAITTKAWNGENVMALKKFTTLYFHSQFRYSGNMTGGRPGNCAVKMSSPVVPHNSCRRTNGHLIRNVLALRDAPNR